MVAKVLIKRTSTPNSPPAVLDPGELALEMADPTRLWVGVPPALDIAGKKLLFDSAASGFADAPVDGTTYGRNNAVWKREERGANAPGVLRFVSTTALRFNPYNGNSIRINGIWYEIPAAGIAISNTGLAAGALSYIYLYDSGGGVLAAELSATSHATSASPTNNGCEVKFGDETRSLIGMVYGDTGGVFADTKAKRYVRSWFNRQVQNTSIGAALSAQATTTNMTAWVEFSTALRTHFLIWANEPITAHAMFLAWHSASGGLILAGLMFDNPVNVDQTNRYCGMQVTANNWCGVYAHESNDSLSEGHHWASLAIWTAHAGTMTVGRATAPPTYPSIHGRIG